MSCEGKRRVTTDALRLLMPCLFGHFRRRRRFLRLLGLAENSCLPLEACLCQATGRLLLLLNDGLGASYARSLLACHAGVPGRL